MRCNSKAAFDELLKSKIEFAGHELRIDESDRIPSPEEFPMDDIEITFGLIKKDVEHFDTELLCEKSVDNRITPELRYQS